MRPRRDGRLRGVQMSALEAFPLAREYFGPAAEKVEGGAA